MSDFLNKYIPKGDRPGVLFVIILGTFSHFFYQWSGGNGLIALFCPINESTWEHLKLLFFPYLIWCIWDYSHSPKIYLTARLYCRYLGVFCGMLSIITLFYTYTGMIGTYYLILDILIFLSGMVISFALPPLLMKWHISPPSDSIVYLLWVLTLLLFFTFTGFPPDIPLFYPPS